MIEYILFFIGIVLLLKGADYLIEGSSLIAKKVGIPTIVIGLTIVAFGTSMPELVVNIIAAIKGSTQVAFGNIIGSNIANILLILGITAVICPITVKSSTIWKQIPFALLAVIILLIVSNYLLIDKIAINHLLRVSGIIFLCFFIIFLYYVFELAKKSRMKVTPKEAGVVKHKNYVVFLMIIGGLVGLYFGGKWVVEGAIFVAKQFGLSEFLISATIVAIGTSLPELATGIIAAKKRKIDLAVGNAIGSNIFNIFWILGITAIIAPVIIPAFVNLDMIFLAFITFLLFLFMFIGERHKLERWQGIVFILLYFSYIVFILLRG